MGRLALVLSGGGARGAYEGGVIHYIRTGLPKAAAVNFDIISGSSAGAINAAAMASMAQDPVRQGNTLKELWLKIKQDEVYRRGLGAAAEFIGYSLSGILRNLTTFNLLNLGKKKGPHFNAFLDTTPLKTYLKKNIPWKQIAKNVKHGPVDALTVTVTNTRSGRGELFIQKKPGIIYSGNYRSHEVNMQTEHIMASAAIPIIFPTVKVGDIYYTDGSLRFFTPMSPAIQLGADRIVVIGLRHQMSRKEVEIADSQAMLSAPSVAELMARIMNGLFLDRVQYDVEQVLRLNEYIEWGEHIYGNDFMEKINRHAKKTKHSIDTSERGLQKIQVVDIFPSEFITAVFSRWFQRRRKGSFEFSALEKLLIRLLDIDAAGAIELLSFLTFATDYLRELVDLGYEDAKRNRHRLIELLASG